MIFKSVLEKDKRLQSKWNFVIVFQDSVKFAHKAILMYSLELESVETEQENAAAERPIKLEEQYDGSWKIS